MIILTNHNSKHQSNQLRQVTKKTYSIKLIYCGFFSESAEQGRHSVSNTPARDKVYMIQNHIEQLDQQRHQHVSIL